MKFIDIKGTSFLMGAVDEEGFPEDHERPRAKVSMNDFEIGDTPVTNADFKIFVDETGYISEAEIAGWSFVFYSLVEEKSKEKAQSVKQLPWWRLVKGASWNHPFGPYSGIDDILNHPVVHVSRNDALAYCKWSKTRLPSEAEWEFAARGGANDLIYPWGSELEEGGAYHANTWQDLFPSNNNAADGFIGTAPVYTYQPNAFGLYQVIGNVWEWCSNPRGIPLTEFQNKSSIDFWRKNNFYSENEYAMRGGSFLCHCSYCNRYRLGARNGNTANSTRSNVGFRVVREEI